MKPDEIKNAAATLYTTTVELLKRNKKRKHAVTALADLVAKDRDLLGALCEHYIEHVAADMSGEKLGSDQSNAETHVVGAAPKDDSAEQKTAPPVVHTHAKRGARAIASIQRTLAKALFILPDGRDIRELQWHELVKEARKYETAARLLRYLETHAANADPFAFVRDVVSDKTIEKAIAYAKSAENSYADA